MRGMAHFNSTAKWMYHQLITPTPQHHNRFTALFPGPPGWAGARRELLDFMVQGKINRGRHTDHPAGRHSIRTNQCPPLPSPHHYTYRPKQNTLSQQQQPSSPWNANERYWLHSLAPAVHRASLRFTILHTNTANSIYYNYPNTAANNTKLAN